MRVDFSYHHRYGLRGNREAYANRATARREDDRRHPDYCAQARRIAAPVGWGNRRPAYRPQIRYR